MFDRSWYGRVLVERIDGLAANHEWQRAYDEINDFERLMVADGVPVVKLFLHISKHEQARRFAERRDNPLKSWKLNDADWHAHKQYDAYYEATNDMLRLTNTAEAPWAVIPANYKWFARIVALETICSAVERRLGHQAG